MPFKSEKQRKWMHANQPEMAKKWEKEEKNEGSCGYTHTTDGEPLDTPGGTGDDLEETAKRDYKDEYKKFQSSDKSKKYRAELNKYNRKKGTYGNGDGKDASHKGGKISGFEKESVNRGRKEKSRLKKEQKLREGVKLGDVREELEYAFEWDYVEQEGADSVRFDWGRSKKSMWVHKNGKSSGEIPKDNYLKKAMKKLGIK